MISNRYYIFILGITTCSTAVKVNMHGSLSLGKEVMDTLTYYLRNGYNAHRISGRRSNIDSDPIYNEVRSASLCGDSLVICTGNLEIFMNEYVTALVKSVENVFESVLNENHEVNTVVPAAIFGMLHGILADIKKLVSTADTKLSEQKEAYLWVGIIKKTSSKFQRKSIAYIIDRVGTNADRVKGFRKRLTHKLVTRIVEEETKGLKKLCNEYQICLRSVECTSALNIVLRSLGESPKHKLKEFMRAFYGILPDTTFYARLNEVTANELQVILNDMAYADSAPTQDILKSIHEVVENRLKIIYGRTEPKRGQDIILVHIILSDMDYIYSKQKPDSFHNFLKRFSDWTTAGGNIATHIKNVIKNVEATLMSTSDELVIKLINEVRAFLEMTVDPEE